MEFRMLGPLEVEDGNGVLPLRGPRLRALLAALLVSANEVVPDERLLDELWGDEPPGSGRTALRVRVSQLRKLLGEAIVTRPPGYMLQIEPEHIDACRFERLLGESRQALPHDPARAAATLQEALALWRGPALSGLGERFARAEAGRLDELRLAALETRCDAELALGHHAELVPELEALVAENPLRERLREQLMLALYRSGRQAGALAAYREGRALLVDELGIEPQRELRDLEAAILRQDPALSPGRVVPKPAPDERKLVTVLAACLELADNGDPERMRALLDRCRSALADEIESAGGRLEPCVGETVTAAFGIPVAQEDHPERTLRTALALRRRIEELGDGVSLRIGVETGEVVVSRGREGGSLAGTAVPAAERLAREAPGGGILVGERTIASTRRVFEFGPKGRRGRALVRQLSHTRTPGDLVGRERELEQMLAAYRDAVASGEPRLITLVGDAGVGKTRLVTELWDRLAAESPAPLRRTGRCLAHGRGLTYRPLADVLREELGLLETDPPETIRARLGGREVLGLTLGLDAPPELHPLTAREELQKAWVSLACEMASDGGLVVLVEDLHWAQEPLLDLLERLLDDVGCPLLLVCTARPELEERRPSWGRRRDASSIWLEPLARSEAERLLAGRRVPVPQQLWPMVLERAEGNPFFLEELASSIVEQGAPAPDVPDTVQAVLASRIDLLPPDEKAALQAAAVIGRVFWRGPVRALLDDVTPDFGLLEARDFIRRRPASALAGEREFTFKHALTRDVAYATLSKEARARLHAAFADWLEESGGGRDEHAAFLAHHFAEAARPEDADLAWAGNEVELGRLRSRAIAWLRRAGELAVGRYDVDEALALLHRALDLQPDAELELALWRLVGRANALRHDGEPFLAAMLRAIELSPDQETTAELYADLSFETAFRAGMWRRRPDRELVDGWIDRALELAAPHSAPRARALIARCVWAPAGNTQAAYEASAIAEALGEAELRSYALDARGITSWVSGERDLGRAFEERRFELVDQIQDPDHLADIHYAPVTGCVWLGHFGEARRLAGRHDEITRGLTPHHRIHGVAVLVEVEELMGGWQRIRDDLESRAEASILANLETPCVRSPRSLMVMAVAEHVLGDPDRAVQFEQLADDFRIEGYGHVLETPRIRLALLRGDLETVERLAAEPLPDRGWHRGWMLLSTESVRLDALAALGRRAEIEAWPRERPGTYLEPFWLRALGRVREDEELLQQASRAFEKLRLEWHASETRTLLHA